MFFLDITEFKFNKIGKVDYDFIIFKTIQKKIINFNLQFKS
jgi:hypothetical protein